MKLGVAGKGGVGKTTIAATLARIMAGEGKQVLAVDADSNPNLAIPLGIPRDQAFRITPVPGDLGSWKKDRSGKAFVALSMPVASVMEQYGVTSPGGVRLLVMAAVNHAGTGWRCNAHAMARGITRHLVAEADLAVLDMEAGLEHMGRGTVEHVDTLLVVTEPYYRALDAAARIRDLAKELGVPRSVVVANRVRAGAEREAVGDYCRRHDLDLAVTIPFDESIVEAEQRGLAPFDFAPESPAVQAIRTLAEKLGS